MATHSSVLAWRIPGTGEPGGLPSMGSHRVGHDWRDLAAAVISDAEHLFMCLSAICRLSSEKHPFQSLHPPPFFFFFLILVCMYFWDWASWAVCMFWRWIPCGSLPLQIISTYSEGCPCLSLRVSFWNVKAFKVNLVPFSDLRLCFIFLRGRSTKNLLHSCQIVSCLYFSQEFHSIHPHN